MGNEKPIFRLPARTHRAAIFGRTGTGKTQFGAFILSAANFDEQPWVIVDYKRDELLNAIDRAKEIGFDDIPKHPGLYILHANPEENDEQINAFMRKVWKQTHVGLLFDEMYMVPQRPALPPLLIQGRSLHIPVISLSQRPSWLSRFVLSEADHVASFHLNDPDDQKKVARLMPSGALDTRLRNYHCQWYDVGQNALFPLAPCPDADTILDRIDDRLTPKRKFA